MDFRNPPELERFRREVHSLLEEEVIPEVAAEAASGLELGPEVKRVLAALGRRGWLTPSWPVHLGGIGASPAYTSIVENALAYFRVLPAGRLVGVGVAGPMILRFGSEQQRQRYLPAIARGEMEFCLAYTEPQAGSDLGALETRAWRDGDDYVIEGNKVFNTRAHYADYHWLIARTDTSGGRREGYTFFIVDSASDGISVQPMIGLSGKRTNVVFYDRVRVPAANLVGEEGRGWEYMTSAALAFERVFPVGDLRRELEELLSFARAAAGLSAEQRSELADVAVRLQVAEMLATRVTWMQERGTVPAYEADTLKVFLGEAWQQLANLAINITGLPGSALSGADSPERRLLARCQHLYLDTIWRTIAGGTSEVTRTLVAIRGLGLPKQ